MATEAGLTPGCTSDSRPSIDSASTGLPDGSTAMSSSRGSRSGPTAFSDPDTATTIVFTDPALNSSVVVKGVHLSEVRRAVNAMRAAAGLPATNFADTPITPGATVIKELHITQARSALSDARTAIGLPGIAYTDGTLTAGTAVKGVHFAQLREGTR